MKRIIALLVISILTIGINQVSGQSLKDLVKKKQDTKKEQTEEKKENKAEGAVRKGVNKGLDRLFGTSSKDEKDEQDEVEKDESNDYKESSDSNDNDFTSKTSATGIGMNTILSGLGITGTTNAKDSYNFDAFIEMTITNYDTKGKEGESGKYISYIDADSPDYAIAFADDDKEEEMLMIFDTENQLMLTLINSDGEKTGFAVAYTEDQIEAIKEGSEVEENDSEVESDSYDVKKTGKTKKILGYKCEEYVTEDENSMVSIWVTDDLGKNIDKAFMKNSNFSGLFMYAHYTDGFVMEYVIEEKDDHEKTVMTVTDIDVKNETRIKTTGYTIMNTGALEGIMGDDEEEE